MRYACLQINDVEAEEPRLEQSQVEQASKLQPVQPQSEPTMRARVNESLAVEPAGAHSPRLVGLVGLGSPWQDSTDHRPLATHARPFAL